MGGHTTWGASPLPHLAISFYPPFNYINCPIQDVAQLLAEVMLFADLQPLQLETKAAMLQAILSFGLDAIALLGFNLCLRCHYGVGRSFAGEETQWLADAAGTVIAHASGYLLSGMVGDLSLGQLLEALPS